MDIGLRIKEKREELKMTQDELAAKVGYKSRSSINKIEIDGRGLPQSKIKQFADALDTTPAFLMGWDMEKKSVDEIYYISEDKKQIIKAIEELDADDIKFVMDMINKLKK